MARGIRHHQRFTPFGWPLFTASQTDIRLALCRRALCPDRSLALRFKDCYESDSVVQQFCKLEFLAPQYFAENLLRVGELGWGGRYKVPRVALEGAFYPFIRCVVGHRPVDQGCIWIGTKHDYPRIFVNNHVADWLCPYSSSGHVMTEPFEPLPRVIANWGRLSNPRIFPCLLLPPVPDL
jgi:hypothetical protein